ncbi:ATP-binding cassette domain-containing protein [Weissella diestrammenae]|uniref:ATP-binding cassette domain-containing protein n=1 Tax=Weissella diestrammenae TaxID=1162633 RepID=A0A7G9T6H8_9LACO|nr:ABC transporter ATP-binding protein/permease [Weissella diestrammenae]MCM0583242.1 ATP-binding cassette domain-containing protein [Weissella diestrammenae]QNN75703.1 ATP-binding cassette domain-containing protein [Weissella diestrammenae]
MAFLELRQIKKSYFLGKQEFPVLKGIDLDFELGEFVSVLGESGGGKSTLMNIIGGLDRNFDGVVTINGEKLDHKKERKLDEYRRGTIGYIYQSYNLISHLTVLDNVLISLDMTTMTHREREARAKALLAKVGLADQIKKHPNQLSGGQKQRVAIARALAPDPQVIIADEPTGALDSQNTKEVLAILQQIAEEGKLVIAVTHSQEVANHGTRIVHLADGKIDNDERIKAAYPLQSETSGIHSKPMSFMASFQNAWKHFAHNFWRNSLIMLGTAIGLFAVLLFSGLGNGINAYINKQVGDLANPNYPTVLRNVTPNKEAKGKQGTELMSATMQTMATDYKKATISESLLKEIKKTKYVAAVEPGYQFSNVTLAYGDTKVTTPQYQTWTHAYSSSMIKAGHAPKAGEAVVDKKTFAQVIDKKDWRSVIGKEITISFVAFNQDNVPTPVTETVKISGVVDSQTGAMVSANAATMKKTLKSAGANTDYTFVSAKVADTEHVKAATKALNAVQVDGQRAFVAISVGSILDTINTIVSLATTVLAAISGISLVVSALMIIVTMYMSVSERTKEIGILRALGESKRDIRRLFTSESLIIGLISAGLSLIMAYGFGFLLNKALYAIAKFDMIQVTWGNVAFAIIIALLISFLAALTPARRASRLNPIDALAAD